MSTASPRSHRLSGDETFVVVLLRIVKGYGTPVAGALSALFVGASTHPAFEQQAWLMPVGIGLGLASVVGVFAVHPSYPKLTDQRNEARAQAADRASAMRGALRGILKSLMREIDLTNTHYRVSIYCHSDACFLMLARHSAHSKHIRPGRVRYREAADVITDAWAEGWSVVVDLPATKAKRVDAQVQKQGIARDDANGLTMPSRSLVGYRLIHDGDPVGVLVLESTQPRGVDHETKQLLDHSRIVPLLATILASDSRHFEGIVELPASPGWWRLRAAATREWWRTRGAKPSVDATAA